MASAAKEGAGRPPKTGSRTARPSGSGIAEDPGNKYRPALMQLRHSIRSRAYLMKGRAIVAWTLIASGLGLKKPMGAGTGWSVGVVGTVPIGGRRFLAHLLIAMGINGRRINLLAR